MQKHEKKTKIMWLSRHKPLTAQLAELERLFGKFELQQASSFKNADQIIEEYKAGGYDEIVIVAPLSVIAHLVSKGVKPLWAEMEVVVNTKELDPQSEVEAQGRRYRFARFRRIAKVEVQYEEFKAHDGSDRR